MYEVKVKSTFNASHAIPMANGEMEPLHEHAWGVEVVFAGAELDDRGVLLDFVAIEQHLQRILAPLDGANLNEHPFLEGRPSSAEHVARRIYELLSAEQWHPARLSSVMVREAPGCTVRFAPRD